MFLRNNTLFILLIGFLLNLSAQAPIFPHLYTADPSARVFNDTLFVYPSHDQDQATWFSMEDYHVFSTVDMENWTDHGVAFSVNDVNWASKYAWAPDCVQANGKYYFYYPFEQDYIGVAVSDKPSGPFVDPLGKPLISRETDGVVAPRDLIDPGAFIDDDGQAYLYFGQNKVNVVKLNKDMISFDGKVQILEGTDGFFEAIWMHKYQETYYLSYSGRGKILYCTADNPLGPFTYQGEILDKVNSITNHHSIVEYKGQWYLFYHTSDLYFSKHPEDDGSKNWKGLHPYRRSVCFVPLSYDVDGRIIKVTHSE